MTLLGLAVPGPRSSAATDPSSTIVAPGLGKQIDDYLTRLSGFGYSGAMVVVKGGTVVIRKGYGLANDSTHTPVTPATVFDIGSAAKIFTAAAVMLLENRGRLSLDDSLAMYLPNVPADKRAISIRQLLTHTSGMDSDFPVENPSYEDYEEVSRDVAIARILAMPLIAPPGTEWSYSNPGFQLLAAIVERASRVPFREFIRKELLEPVGMRHTGFWGSLPPVPEAELARSYNERGETANLHQRSGTTWYDMGGGGMVSTVSDLHLWMEAMRHDRILPAAARKQMWTQGLGRTGFAWFVDPSPEGRPRVHHGGDYIGFGAEIAFYPEDSLVMIHLANRNHDVLGTRYAADRVIPKIIFGQKLEMWPNEPFDVPPAWRCVSGTDARQLAGTYRLSSGGTLVITPGGGVVHVAARGQDAIEALVPATDSSYAAWRACNARLIAMIEGVAKGDTTLLEPTLRIGAPIPSYRNAIQNKFLRSEEYGALLERTTVGTIPAAFPRKGNKTSFDLRFERGQDQFAFGWANGRVINTQQGAKTLASTPFRADPAGGGLVGWNIIWARELRLTPVHSGGAVSSITIHAPGRPEVTAHRVTTGGDSAKR